MATRRETNPTPAGPVRVLVADYTRMGTQLILEALRPDNRFIAVESLQSPEHFDACVFDFKPHVALIGVRANGNSRANLNFVVRARDANLHAVALFDVSTHDLVVNAFQCGAHGVICRDDGLDAVRSCIHAVHLGQIWANSAQLGFVLEVFSRRWVPQRIVDSKGRALLSKRELDVVRCVSAGLTNRDVASRLGLSEHTVKNYMFRTFDKLGVSNRAELILYAMNHGCLHETRRHCQERCDDRTEPARIKAPHPPHESRPQSMPAKHARY
jgi:DNA-binding NarL/FixJ family response regulator